MKWALALLIMLLSITIIAQYAVGNSIKNKIPILSGGTINYPTVIQRILFGGSSALSVQDYARAEMFMNHNDGASKISQIHSINSSVICLLYRNARAVYTGGAEYQMFVNNDWLLKDPNGTLIRSTVHWSQRMVDVGNASYQQWVANWLKTNLNKYGYNGVFLDDLLPSTEILWSTSPSPAINPRTKKAWTDDEFKQAIIALVNKVKDTIGDRFVVGNGIWQGQQFFGPRNQGYVALLTQSKIDGIEAEAWIMDRDRQEWYSETKWKQSIDLVVWLENNFLNESGKMFLPVAQNAEPYNGQGESLPSATTKDQYVLYTFTSLLLGISSNSHYLNLGWTVDEFSQSLFKIELGSPQGAYYIVNGTHVYARDFSKAKVLVNPTAQPYTVGLGGGYIDLNDVAVASSISVAAHTGMILKKK